MSECFPKKLPWDRPHILLWVILVFSAISVIFLGGKRRAFGVFVAELHVRFPNVSLAELNWIGDSYSAFGYLTTTASSALILYCNRRYAIFQFIGSVFILLSCITSYFVPNPHWLFLTHTVLHGIGSSLILSSTGLVVNEYFGKSHPYHVLATTLVSGGSVASIIFVNFFAVIIHSSGWRNSFLILGALYFVVCGMASLFMKKNEEIPEPAQKRCCDANIRTTVKKSQIPLLILWTLDRILTSIVTYGLLMNLADYQRREKKNLLNSTILTTLFAAGEASTYLIGAILTAITKDILYDRLRYILLIFTFFMGTCLVSWEYAAKLSLGWLSSTLGFFSGFFLGPSITFLFPAGEEITRLPGHMAYPFSLGGMGCGMFLSPLLSAMIAESFKYQYFFLVQGGLIYLKFVILLAACLIIHFCHAKMEKRNDYEILVEDKNSSEAPSEVVAETPALAPQKDDSSREKEPILGK